MKTIVEFLLDKAHKTVSGGITIPKGLYFTYKDLKGNSIIDAMLNNFNNYFSREDMNKLFKGYKDALFDIIYWNGNSRGFGNADDAINELFPSKHGDNYYSYLDDAELYEEISPDENVFIARFISQDDKAICIVDTGDLGHVYVCVEK